MRKIRQLVSAVLVLTMLATSIPINAIAADVKNDSNTSTSTDSEKPEGKILREITEKRGSNVKYFLLDDGSYEADVYKEPVHYFENGEWKDIDNSLQEENDPTINNQEDKGDAQSDLQTAYVNENSDNYSVSNTTKVASDAKILSNKDNDVKIKVAEKSKSKKLVQIKKDNYEIDWNIDGVKNTKSSVVKNKDTVTPETSQDKNKSKEKLEVEKQNDEKRALKNINSTVKFSNIFSNVDLEYSLMGQSLKENIILNKQTNENKFTYNLKTKNLIPVIQKDNTIIFYDKSNQNKAVFKFKAPFMVDAKGAIDGNLKLELNQSKSGYQIVMTLDKEWINSVDRAFPIKIDPDIESSTDLYSIYDTFVCSNDTENKYQNMFNRVGQTPVVGTARTYIKFVLPQLSTGDMVTAAQLNLAAYADSGFSTCSGQVNVHRVTQDFNTQNINWSTQPQYDNKISDYFLMHSSSTNYWASWDITSMVKDWYNTGTNYGLMLEEDSDGGHQSFISSNVSDANASIRPDIMIHYINNTGLENYWTYHSQDAGRAGTGYINDYNGNLVFTHDDLSMTGSKSPISINHVFNSNDKTYNLGCGNGWRLNYNQRFEWKTIQDKSYYVYTDGDGTRHYFHYISGQTQFNDELNLGLTVTVENDNTYTIKDKKGGKINFWAVGDINYISDSNGNRTYFDYGASLKNNVRMLTSVTDSAKRVTRFDYDSTGQLIGITDPSGRKTSYEYTNEMLTKITYSDGKVTTYSYDGNNNLRSAVNYDGLKLTYDYYSVAPFRVRSVTQSNTDGTLGEEADIQYGSNTTKFTNAEGKSDIYQFDDCGKTISIKDSEGNAEYYKYDDSNNKTKLNAESKLQKTINNLLLNAGIEQNKNWTNGTDGGQGTEGITTEDKHYGNQSIKITKSDKVSRCYSQQTVTLEPGKTYTASAYVKTSGVSSGSNCGAYLWTYYADKNGQYHQFSSKPVTGTTNDWQRIQVTFTLPADALAYTPIVRCGMQAATGTAYFDDFQLETGSSANRYNMIENCDFSGGYGIPNGWSSLNCTTDDGVTYREVYGRALNLDLAVFKICGAAGVTKKASQTIKISGTSGNSFILSGWAKADSVPINSDREFNIQLVFNNSSGTAVQTETVKFNPGCSDWQYASGPVVAKSDYASVTVSVVYNNNANTALFDGIQLYKDEFGASYQYDSKGNVISTVDAAKQNSTFEYDNDNNLKSLTDPKGNKFAYEYDSNHNVTKATTAANVVYNFKYDSSGNPVTATIGDDTGYISSSATYSASGNYMSSLTDSSGNTVKFDYDENKGTLKNATDANNKTTTYGYDALDRLTSVSKNADNQTISNSYGYQNDRISTINQNGFSYNFGYDSLGNNTTVSVGNQNLITNNYEARTSKLLSSTYGNGQTVSMLYDGNDNIAGRMSGEDNTIGISYSGNVENYGIKTVNSNGAVLGTIGQSLRLESLAVSLSNMPKGMHIKYQAYVQGSGWQDWVYDGATAGTIGKGLRMEAVRIALEGAPAGYIVQYEVHVEGIGWMDPVQNGEFAGTSNADRRIEAIKINVVKLKTGYKYDANLNLAHKDDYVSGGIHDYFYDLVNRLIKVEETDNGLEATTSFGYDENNNTNSISEKINGKTYKTGYTFDNDNRPKETSVNSQGKITSNYDKLGRKIGEVINTGKSNYNVNYNYKNNVITNCGVGYSTKAQANNWQTQVNDGADSGSTGKGLSLEAIKIQLTNDLPAGMKIKYQAHVQDIGWMDPVYDGAVAGTQDQSKRLEAVKIQLENAPVGYQVQYQVHVSQIGWMTPVYDGAIAGTVGKGLAIEAIRINIIKSNTTTTKLESIINNGIKTSYSYDANGNISSIVKNTDCDNWIKNGDFTSGTLYWSYINSMKVDTTYRNVAYANVTNGQITIEQNLYNIPHGTYNMSAILKSSDFSLLTGVGFVFYYTDGTYTDCTWTSNKITDLGNGYKQFEKSGSSDTSKTISYVQIRVFTNQNVTADVTVARVNFVGSNGANSDKATGIQYKYNELNELIREDNAELNKTITYTYDAGGNITAKTEYAYTTAESLGTPTSTISYGYGDSNWKDKLTSYNNLPITYDQIGNPLAYNGWTYTWEQGRQLSGMSGNGNTISYKYNDSGIRTQKTVNGVTTTYHLVGDKVTYETSGTDNICNTFKYNYSQNVQSSYHGIDIPVDTSKSYTYSFDAYISSDANIANTGTTFIADGEKGFGCAFNYDNTKKGTWQHFQVTQKPTSNSAWIMMYPTTSQIPATTGYIMYKNFQFKEAGTNTNLFGQPLDTNEFNLKGNGVFECSRNEQCNTFKYDYSQKAQSTYHGLDIALDAEKSYTYSFDAYISSDSDIANTGTTFIADGEQGFGCAFNYDNTKKGTWQHFETTQKPTSGTAWILLYPSTSQLPATKGCIMYKNVQFKEVGSNINLFWQPLSNDEFSLKGNGVFEPSCNNDSDKIYYTYDSNNDLVSMNLNGVEYYYVRNGQNDIIGLIDGTGAQVVSYTYDSWGKLISIKDAKGNDVTNDTTNVGYKNPYRYRGYRYDTETGLYYLNSRYYNSEWGRFINADAIAGNTGELLSHNVFAYCSNNSIMREDESGYIWNIIGGAIVGGLIGGLTSAVTQYAQTGSINMKSVFVSAGAGALSGALAASGFGMAGQVLGNALISGASYLVDTAANGKSFNPWDCAANVTIGAFSGLIGGRGLMNSKENLKPVLESTQSIVDREVRRNNTKYAWKAITRAAEYATDVYCKEASKTLGRYCAATAFSTGASYLYNRFTSGVKATYCGGYNRYCMAY